MSKLLVPTMLEALLVDQNGNSIKYANCSPHFELLGNGMVLGDAMTPDPFTTTSDLKQGVHLHWSLPDALTHAVQDKTGEMIYPAVPNRWIVIRIFTDYSGTYKPVFLKSWIIESDYLYYQDGLENDKDWKENENSIAIPTLDSKIAPYMYLGRHWEYNTKPRSYKLEKYLDKLTAIGPGDPLFAAYYPNCRSVFGFHDKLDDIERGPLAYMVAGWYATPNQDPLNGKTAKDWRISDNKEYMYLDELKWAVPLNLDNLPGQTLCHSMLYNILWLGKDGSYSSGAPAGNLDIASGNTSVEALSALISSKLGENESIARIMEAIQYELLSELDHPDGIAKLEEEIHQKSFASCVNGSYWVIRKTESKNLTDSEPSGTPFPEGIGKLLDTLNETQKIYDRLKMDLSSQQWEIYSVWYKYISHKNSPGYNLSTDYEQLIKNLGAQIDSNKKTLDEQNNLISEQSGILIKKINQELPLYTLVKANSPAFWQPNDPVVLISGTNVQRSFKHGFDDKFSDDGFLHGRLTGQTIAGINLLIAGKPISLANGDIKEYYNGFNQGSYPIPDETESIIQENLFLDTNQSKLIAVMALRKAGVSSPASDQINTLSSQIYKIQTNEESGLQGTLPSSASFGEWAPPWTPLFMEWETEYTPGSDSISSLLENWQLEDIDYHYSPDSLKSTQSSRFQGSIIITPHAVLQLKNSFQKYLSDHKPGDPDDPGYQKIWQIVHQLDNMNILSQKLSGFNDSLLMRKQTLQFPVFDIPEEYEGNPTLAKKVSDWADIMNYVSPVSQSNFYPIRAGFLKILNLWVVDAFGQIQDININPPKPICSDSVKTPSEAFDGLITLPPRLTQPARLLFRWISAKDALQETNSDPATSPVCGWVLPNHIDRSIMFYDSAGILLGSLVLFYQKNGTEHIRWENAPGTAYAPDVLPDKMDQELRHLITALLDQEKNGVPAFQGLMKTIDETLWNIDPQGERSDSSLSVLVGRPLALARAYLKLELKGLPANDDGKGHIRKQDKNGFDQILFPVRLGNAGKISDGLIGYFIANGEQTYNRFYPTSGALDTQKGNPYISYEDNLNLSCAQDAGKRIVTLLIDPRASVHITSGILPTKRIDLPNEHISNALSNMNITLKVKPFIGSSSTLNIPVPSSETGKWSWISKTGVHEWKEIENIKPVNPKAGLSPDTKKIYEGWLKLKKAL